MWPFSKREKTGTPQVLEPEVTEAVIEGVRMWIFPDGELVKCRSIAHAKEITESRWQGAYNFLVTVMQITFTDGTQASVDHRNGHALIRHLRMVAQENAELAKAEAPESAREGA